jgi:hypothetical protein
MIQDNIKVAVFSLLEISKCLIQIAHTPVDVPGKHLPPLRVGTINIAIDGSISQTTKLLLIISLLEQIERLRLGTPVKGFCEGVFGLGKIAVICIDEFLQDDLGWNMCRGF